MLSRVRTDTDYADDIGGTYSTVESQSHHGSVGNCFAKQVEEMI